MDEFIILPSQVKERSNFLYFLETNLSLLWLAPNNILATCHSQEKKLHSKVS